MTAFEIAWKLHTLGFSVVPSGGGDKGKAPLVEWAELQKRQPSDAEVWDWQERFKPQLWGFVTGARSGIVVIDVETPEQRIEFEAKLGPPHVIPPRKGGHWLFEHPGHHVKTVAGLLSGVDIRGDGGFCNVVGTRSDGEYTIVTLPAPENLLPWGKVPDRIRAAMNGRKSSARGADEGIIAEGQRNSTLASLAESLRRPGLPQEAIEAALLQVNQLKCRPPLREEEVRAIAASVARYPSSPRTCMYDGSGQPASEAKGDKNGTDIGTAAMQKQRADVSRFESLSQRVSSYVRDTSGWWDTRELDIELGITLAKDKENRKKILQRLREQGVIEQHPKVNRQWRYVDTRVTHLAFKVANSAGALPLRWPLRIEKYVNIFPGNLAVVAGSPNAGKTALLLNFLHLNQGQFPCFYFCSEMGATELRNRLEQFPGIGIDEWQFEAIERASDFADVIRPDCVNVIDYLEMTTQLYEVNLHLTAIGHKLGSGIAVVGLQKKQGAQFGSGQEFSLEKPKLYVSMDRGKLQIVKGKCWAMKNVNPNGLQVSFKIIGGCQFEITADWDWKG